MVHRGLQKTFIGIVSGEIVGSLPTLGLLFDRATSGRFGVTRIFFYLDRPLGWLLGWLLGSLVADFIVMFAAGYV